jgi:hypothetical protein
MFFLVERFGPIADCMTIQCFAYLLEAVAEPNVVWVLSCQKSQYV